MGRRLAANERASSARESHGALSERRRRRATASPDQLLEAASELMIERGSIDVSLSEIANRSGVNAALVSYYFGNKAGMYLALIRRRLSPGIAQLQELLDSDRQPHDKLRIHISGMVNTYFRYPYANHVIHALTADSDRRFGEAVVLELSKPVAEFQRAVLQEGYEKGVFKKIDALLFYFHVVGACDQLFHGRYQAELLFGFTAVDDNLRRRYSDHLYSTIFSGILA